MLLEGVLAPLLSVTTAEERRRPVKYLIGMVMTFLMSGNALATGDVTVDDVKKLARAGVSEETILAFLKENQPSFRPTAQDIVDLKEAGVTPKVLVYLLEPKGAANAPPPSSPPASHEGVRPVYVYSTRPTYDYAWPHYSYWTYSPYYYFGGYGYGSHYGYGHHGYGHHGLGGGHSYGHSGHHGGGHGHR